MTSQSNAYPEYVENELTEEMWVRRDLASSAEEAVAYVVRELGLDDGMYDPASVTEVHMRLYPPDHPDAPAEARAEGADFFKVVAPGDDTVAYWGMRT